MLVVAARIAVVGDDTVVLMILAAIIGAGFLFLPTFMLTVVVAVIAIVLVPAFVFAVIVVLVAAAMIVTILGRSG